MKLVIFCTAVGLGLSAFAFAAEPRPTIASISSRRSPQHPSNRSKVRPRLLPRDTCSIIRA